MKAQRCHPLRSGAGVINKGLPAEARNNKATGIFSIRPLLNMETNLLSEKITSQWQENAEKTAAEKRKRYQTVQIFLPQNEACRQAIPCKFKKATGATTI